MQQEHWFISLLKAIASWEGSEYFIDGEAFDWFELAKRACSRLDGQVPKEEMERFLLHGQPPLRITPEQFRELIGPVKYQAYLNYFYGIVVERALQQVVKQEIIKRRRCLGLPEEPGLREEVFNFIYNASDKELVGNFRQQKGYSHKGEPEGLELKEFTYWLFKYRLKHNPPEKVASDTKRGLKYLQRHSHPPFIYF